MMLIQRKLEPMATMPPLGTVMCYGPDYASPTTWKRVLEPYESTGFNSDGSTYRHTSRFGRLVAVLPGNVCEIDTTPDEKEEAKP